MNANIYLRNAYTYIFRFLPFASNFPVVLVLILPDVGWLELKPSEGIVVSVGFERLHGKQELPPSLHQLDQTLQT